MRIHAYAMTLLSDFDVDFEDRQFSNMKYIRYISFGATFIVEHFCYPTVALVWWTTLNDLEYISSLRCKQRRDSMARQTCVY